MSPQPDVSKHLAAPLDPASHEVTRSQAKKQRARERKGNARRKLNAWVDRNLPAELRQQAKDRWFEGGWREQLAILLKAYGDRREDGGVAAFETQRARSETLFLAFGQLREDLGCKLNDVRIFATKHLRKLIALWIARGQGSATINQRLSILRSFARWIRKPGVVPSTNDLERIGFDPEVAKRVSVATQDKSWENIDKAALLAEIEKYDLRFGLIFQLQDLFGLRKQEAIMFCPHEHHHEHSIKVWDGPPLKSWEHLGVIAGTKGGKFRQVPVTSEAQRELLARCEAAVARNDSMSGKERPLRAARRRYEKIAERFGITRKEIGVTGHGLRHGYAHERHRQEFGQEPPVRDAAAQRTKGPVAKVKRSKVAEELGHSRASITAAYCGSARAPKSPESESPREVDGVEGKPDASSSGESGRPAEDRGT
jgi:integrase